MLKRLTQLETPPPWGLLTAFSAVVAMFLAVVIGTTIAQIVLGETTTAGLLFGWAVGMALTVMYVRLTALRTQLDSPAMALTAKDVRLPIVALFALGMVISLDVLSLAVTGQFEVASSELFNFASEDVSFFGWIMAALLMILLQPVAEELVFRGVLFPVLRTAGGAWGGLFFCAAVSALFHFIAYPPSNEDRTLFIWYGLIHPLLAALTFCGVRAHTRSTIAAMLAHAIFGAFFVIKAVIVA